GQRQGGPRGAQRRTQRRPAPRPGEQQRRLLRPRRRRRPGRGGEGPRPHRRDRGRRAGAAPRPEGAGGRRRRPAAPLAAGPLRPGRRPSEVLAAADPTPGAPGLNQAVALPTFPKATLASPDSVWNSDPGRRVWEKVNAMAAWQNTLAPPRPPEGDPDTLARGRRAFARAGCGRCHAGPRGTNDRVVPVTEVGT